MRAGGIRPHPPRALIGRGRLDDARTTRCQIDPGDVIAGQRGVPDVALRRDRDAVRSAASRRLEHAHIAGLRFETAIDPGLPGEPVDTAPVEDAGIEVGVGFLFRQTKQPNAVIAGIDAHDCVLPAFGHPGRAVGADDDAVGRRTLAEIDQFERTIPRIQSSQRAVKLTTEPDRAIGRGCDGRANPCRRRPDNILRGTDLPARQPRAAVRARREGWRRRS